MARQRTVNVKVLVSYEEDFGPDPNSGLGSILIFDAATTEFDVSVVAPKGAYDLAGMICADLRPWLDAWKRKLEAGKEA